MRCLSYSLPSRGPILLLISSLFVTSFASLTIDYQGSICNNASNYTDGSIYSKNLNRVMSYLIQNGSQSGFNVSSYGQSPNKVYGLIQCIGDLSLRECSNCSQEANTRLQKYCPNDIGGQIWMTFCYLQYNNSSLVSKLDNPPMIPPNSFTTSNTSANGTLTLSKPKKKSSKKLPIILGILGGVILVICMFALRRKLKSLIFGETETLVPYHKERHDYSAEKGLLSDGHVFIFSLETLIEATQNFHHDNKLGEGGFGAVYRGTTKDGKDIAVKKLSATSSQGKNEFMNEVKLVANIQHRNLVKLLGCCLEGDKRFLVYEYLPNKSLDSFLFDPEKSKHLDWEKRDNIISGIARGLLYLHEDSKLRIIHRDVKASNILLDDKLNPKIADFGLARLFPEEETHIETRVAGTFGYMAPEYAMRGQLSVKADVYSFGVLLLEIVGGRKNIENRVSQEMENLLEWAWRLYKANDVLKMVDSMVIQNCPQEQAKRYIHVGLLCVQANASLRPVISNVLRMISSNTLVLPNPARPAFVSCSQSLSPSRRPSLGLSSVNETSVSELKPR